MSTSCAPSWLRWISGDEIREMLTWDLLIPAVSQTLSAYSRGPNHTEGAVQPLRAHINISQSNGDFLVMPGYLKKEAALATKILSLFPDNKALGLPTHSAMVIVHDPKTGLPQASLEGESITELRTAASSAVATKLLISKAVSESSSVVAILGAGVQARSHARVLHYCIRPKQIKIWARRREASQALCKILVSEGLPCLVSETVFDAVQDADVINTCTLAKEPILKKEWVKPGAHINSVGAPRPDWQELDPELVKSCVVYADSRESAYAEAGDIIKSKSEVFAEVGEVINGVKPANREETTIFKSLGLAVEDAVAAKLVVDLMESRKQ